MNQGALFQHSFIHFPFIFTYLNRVKLSIVYKNCFTNCPVQRKRCQQIVSQGHSAPYPQDTPPPLLLQLVMLTQDLLFRDIACRWLRNFEERKLGRRMFRVWFAWLAPWWRHSKIYYYHQHFTYNVGIKIRYKIAIHVYIKYLETWLTQANWPTSNYEKQTG